MNNLKIIYQHNEAAYKEVLGKLHSELHNCHNSLDELYDRKDYAALKTTAHNIRNIAGSLGQSKLKIVSAYWEDICADKKTGDIEEYKKIIEHVLEEIWQESIS